jgi:hypothetical protein
MSGAGHMAEFQCGQCRDWISILEIEGHLNAEGRSLQVPNALEGALAAFFEDVDADWSNDNIRPGDFAFRFRAAADRLRVAYLDVDPR